MENISENLFGNHEEHAERALSRFVVYVVIIEPGYEGGMMLDVGVEEIHEPSVF